MSYYMVMVAPDEGEAYEVDIKTRDLVAWETKYDTDLFVIQERGRFSFLDMYRLAHLASVRTGRVAESVDIDQFMKMYDIDKWRPVPDPDPTQTEA